jgi:hypothetical protein
VISSNKQHLLKCVHLQTAYNLDESGPQLDARN